MRALIACGFLFSILFVEASLGARANAEEAPIYAEIEPLSAVALSPVILSYYLPASSTQQFMAFKVKPDFPGFYHEFYPSHSLLKMEAPPNRRLIARAALYPIRPGEKQIDPGTLILSRSGGGELSISEVEYSLPPISVSVQGLPPYQGKNPFLGTVGKYDLTVKSLTLSGGKIQLTIAIQGRGNIRWIQLPHLDFGADFDVVGRDEKVILDFQPKLIYGAKLFFFDLMPLRQGSIELPPVTWVYFNDEAGDYREISAKAEAVHSSKPSLPSLVKSRHPKIPGREEWGELVTDESWRLQFRYPKSWSIKMQKSTPQGYEVQLARRMPEEHDPVAKIHFSIRDLPKTSTLDQEVQRMTSGITALYPQSKWLKEGKTLLGDLPAYQIYFSTIAERVQMRPALERLHWRVVAIKDGRVLEYSFDQERPFFDENIQEAKKVLESIELG